MWTWLEVANLWTGRAGCMTPSTALRARRILIRCEFRLETLSCRLRWTSMSRMQTQTVVVPSWKTIGRGKQLKKHHSLLIIRECREQPTRTIISEASQVFWWQSRAHQPRIVSMFWRVNLDLRIDRGALLRLRSPRSLKRRRLAIRISSTCIIVVSRVKTR